VESEPERTIDRRRTDEKGRRNEGAGQKKRVNKGVSFMLHTDVSYLCYTASAGVSWRCVGSRFYCRGQRYMPRVSTSPILVTITSPLPHLN
jgi:hypothetical protein